MHIYIHAQTAKSLLASPWIGQHMWRHPALHCSTALHITRMRVLRCKWMPAIRLQRPRCGDVCGRDVCGLSHSVRVSFGVYRRCVLICECACACACYLWGCGTTPRGGHTAQGDIRMASVISLLPGAPAPRTAASSPRVFWTSTRTRALASACPDPFAACPTVNPLFISYRTLVHTTHVHLHTLIEHTQIDLDPTSTAYSGSCFIPAPVVPWPWNKTVARAIV